MGRMSTFFLFFFKIKKRNPQQRKVCQKRGRASSFICFPLPSIVSMVHTQQLALKNYHHVALVVRARSELLLVVAGLDQVGLEGPDLTLRQVACVSV
jgi:hypothetical protein